MTGTHEGDRDTREGDQETRGEDLRYLPVGEPGGPDIYSLSSSQPRTDSVPAPLVSDLLPIERL